MFVFAETRAGGGAASPSLLELQQSARKEQLPFEELVVVAGLHASPHSPSPGAEASLRQLTCLSARVKPWDRRMLLVLPIPVGVSGDATPVQILDVGEVAVTFAQDLRDCFPTLVRRNPMSYAPDSDDESGDDDDEDQDMDEYAAVTDRKRLEKEKRELHAHEQQQQQQQEKDELRREAGEFMDKTRVKMLQSLDELFHAFQIQDPVQARAALQREEASAVEQQQQRSGNCQWLCMDLPALAPSPRSPSTGTSAAVTPHNFGLMVSHAASASSRGDRCVLTIPLPRPPRGYFAQDANAADADANADVFQDASVLSFGAKREATSHGGGKTPDETVKNIRMRHASGTFCTLVDPVTTWSAVAAKYSAFLPQVREMQGELRLRRIMGAATNESVTLLLE